MDITKTSDEVELEESKPYREIISSLIYNSGNKTRHLLYSY